MIRYTEGEHFLEELKRDRRRIEWHIVANTAARTRSSLFKHPKGYKWQIDNGNRSHFFPCGLTIELLDEYGTNPNGVVYYHLPNRYYRRLGTVTQVKAMLAKQAARKESDHDSKRAVGGYSKREEVTTNESSQEMETSERAIDC